MPTGLGATGSGPGAWGQGTRDKVSGRPPKGGAGDRAQVYDTTPTQEVAMPDLQT